MRGSARAVDSLTDRFPLEAEVPKRDVQVEVTSEIDFNAVWFGVTVIITMASKARAGVTEKPFDIASHAPPTAMIAQVAGFETGDFAHTLGDAHLHSNRVEQAREQPSRAPGPLPTMHPDPFVTRSFAFRHERFRLEGHEAAPSSRASIAVRAAGPTMASDPS